MSAPGLGVVALNACHPCQTAGPLSLMEVDRGFAVKFHATQTTLKSSWGVAHTARRSDSNCPCSSASNKKAASAEPMRKTQPQAAPTINTRPCTRRASGPLSWLILVSSNCLRSPTVVAFNGFILCRSPSTRKLSHSRLLCHACHHMSVSHCAMQIEDHILHRSSKSTSATEQPDMVP